MSDRVSGIPKRMDPEYFEYSGSGGALNALSRSSERSEFITDDGERKLNAIASSVRISRSMSKKLDPVGVPRIDDVLRDRISLMEKLSFCAEAIAYRRKHFADGKTVDVRFHADRCGLHLLCPFCAAFRSRQVLKRYAKRCDALMAERPGEFSAYMLTFTVKNGPDLVERFEHLTGALRRMLKRVGDGRPSVFSALLGGAYGIEIKRGSGSGLWHPHVHMLALVPVGHYFDFRACKREWLSWTGDSDVLNVEPLTLNDEGSYSSSMREVFKYTTSFKKSDMSDVDRFFVHAHLKGRRLFGNFGLLRDPSLVVDDDDGGQWAAGIDVSGFDRDVGAYLQRLEFLEKKDRRGLASVSVFDKSGRVSVIRGLRD